MKWAPPARPEWAENLIAHGEALGGADQLISLSPQSLIGRAREATGLEDFGPDSDWRPHLEVLCDALERESDLNLAGRVVTGTEILRTLQNRLQLIDLWKRKPELLETPLSQPAFVVGAARSGTSITHELLACDDANRTPLLWEMMHPADAARGIDRREVAHRAAQFWHQLQPEYETMHYNAGDLPNECIYLFMHSFVSDQWLGCHNVPSYGAYMQQLDQQFVYREHKRILQSLSPGRTSTRWVLKAPSHLPLLRFLFRVYPDARIILTHRDPLTSMASGLSLMGTLKWMRCREADLSDVIDSMPGGQAWLWQDLIEARASGALPDDQFIDLRYADLMRAPVEALREVYERLGWEFSSLLAERITRYLAQKPRGAHGRHRYALEDFGLDPAAERERFGPYQERFAIPNEH